MNMPTCIILVGIPGSGKTYYAQKYIEEYHNTVHLSSDAIRKELYGDESIQDNPAAVFELMQKRAVEALNEGKDVVYDCTSITRKDRASIISKLPKFARVECHIVWTPIETCIERDAARERTVGKEVIDKMLKHFQAVYYDEGFDYIKVILPDGFDPWDDKYMLERINAMKIPHDNPHHTLGVADHCFAAHEYLESKGCTDFDLLLAATLHDIGKPYVKAFVNSKGEPDEIAHFYGHQSVGAYIVYGCPDDNIELAWLISTHMDPYLNTKYYNNLPKFLKEKIDLLHEADKNAH